MTFLAWAVPVLGAGALWFAGGAGFVVLVIRALNELDEEEGVEWPED